MDGSQGRGGAAQQPCAAVLVFLQPLLASLPGGPAFLLAAACGLGTPFEAHRQAGRSGSTRPTAFLPWRSALAMVRARGRAWAWALSGLAFALAAASGPSSALFGAVVAVSLGAQDRRGLLAFAAGAAPSMVWPVLAANLLLDGSVLRYARMGTPRWRSQRLGRPGLWQGRPSVALPGMFLSPSRGLLVFSPFLLLAVQGTVGRPGAAGLAGAAPALGGGGGHTPPRRPPSGSTGGVE